MVTAGLETPGRFFPGMLAAITSLQPLEQFDYCDVVLASDLHEKQLEETHSVLMGLSEDSLLKPFRQMSGQAAPGEDLGGWYHYNHDYKWGEDEDGFAPSCAFDQWVSALARMYAITRDQPTRDKVLRLNRLYAQAGTKWRAQGSAFAPKREDRTTFYTWEGFVSTCNAR